jgi:hypothetical protein
MQGLFDATAVNPVSEHLPIARARYATGYDLRSTGCGPRAAGYAPGARCYGAPLALGLAGALQVPG